MTIHDLLLVGSFTLCSATSAPSLDPLSTLSRPSLGPLLILSLLKSRKKRKNSPRTEKPRFISSIQFNSTQFNSTQLNSTQLNSIQFNFTNIQLSPDTTRILPPSHPHQSNDNTVREINIQLFFRMIKEQ